MDYVVPEHRRLRSISPFDLCDAVDQQESLDNKAHYRSIVLDGVIQRSPVFRFYYSRSIGLTDVQARAAAGLPLYPSFAPVLGKI
jgi:hypothetical protein